ncbi:hypothetical protein QKU48_gp0802 [Fadolivirus algeromassiliense]|jgi:hypothetical protein|uniref:Uncharacterized protein n=1 Tax=Fadolivirus FV1/VV64 TaxID=3070911 RepID=A0A7D3QX85_9VIRU|nr:hypothetical protein QKU48_gp0802 [Fadolivirus algeromassiliense]QKF94260.1 hypothetical protein Fadolivirus_1_802 [Fadolivirus FV1/VV64]
METGQVIDQPMESIQPIDASTSGEEVQDSVQNANSELTLDMVNWKPFYSLSRASLGQIMVSFKNILKVAPKNTYETALYSRLKPAVEGLLECYNDILKFNSPVERDVKYYNLIVNLPHGVSENEQHHGSIQMRNAKIGKLIEAAKQRIQFIETRETPVMYTTNQNYLQEFNKMKNQLNDLKDTLDDFEEEFVEAVDQAHKAQQHVH